MCVVAATWNEQREGPRCVEEEGERVEEWLREGTQEAREGTEGAREVGEAGCQEEEEVTSLPVSTLSRLFMHIKSLLFDDFSDIKQSVVYICSSSI